DPAESALDVRRVLLVAGVLDVVARLADAVVALPAVLVDAVPAEEPELPRELVRVGRDGAALARRHVLDRVEREGGRVLRRADHLARALRADGVRTVFEHEGARRGRAERLDIAGEPREVDRHDGLRDPGLERLLDLGDGDRAGLLVHVDEDRLAAGEADRVAGRGPRDRRRQDLVAGLQDGGEDEVERRRARREGEGVLRAGVGRDLLLELGRLRAGGDPAGAEDARDGLDLLLADRRLGEGERRGALPGRERLGRAHFFDSPDAIVFFGAGFFSRRSRTALTTSGQETVASSMTSQKRPPSSGGTNLPHETPSE